MNRIFCSLVHWFSPLPDPSGRGNVLELVMISMASGFVNYTVDNGN